MPKPIKAKLPPSIKPVTSLKRQPVRITAVKPKDDSDVEIEFDDDDDNSKLNDNIESEASEAEELDKQLLASRNSEISDDETIISEKPVVKKIIKRKVSATKCIGSKAQLRALMHKAQDEDDEDADADADGDDKNEEDGDGDVDDKNEEDGENGDADGDGDEEPSTTPTKSRAKKSGKSSKTATKKGPGRPRKTPKKEPIPRKGISRSPQNADSFIEVLYDQPVIMKKIFQFFKNIAASQIQIIFRPKEIIFYAIDHHKKSRNRVRVDATKINHYYCHGVLDVGISTKEMELILNKVDKEYSSIVILSDIESTHRTVTLVLENDMQIDELHRLELIGTYDKMENEEAFIDEDYMIRFEFPSKYFKKTIGDIKTMSSQLSITQEDEDSPIVFEYLTENKRIQSKHTVKDGSKIKLVSNLADGDSFRVDIRIDYIKPISSSQIADFVTVLVDENKAFMTKSYIDDGTIEIKTLTEIIDERPEEDDD